MIIIIIDYNYYLRAYLYLSMLRMVWTHPHAAWQCCQWWVETVHVKCQWAKITVNELIGKLTSAKQQKKNQFFFKQDAFCHLPEKCQPSEMLVQKTSLNTPPYTWLLVN